MNEWMRTKQTGENEIGRQCARVRVGVRQLENNIKCLKIVAANAVLIY